MIDKREELESVYQECMRSYRRLLRGGMVLTILGFLLSVVMFCFGVHYVWNSETLRGFIFFLLFCINFGSGVRSVKQNKQIREDMRGMEVKHSAIMMVMGQFEELEKEKKS